MCGSQPANPCRIPASSSELDCDLVSRRRARKVKRTKRKKRKKIQRNLEVDRMRIQREEGPMVGDATRGRKTRDEMRPEKSSDG
jgi:hypothetical protein